MALYADIIREMEFTVITVYSTIRNVMTISSPKIMHYAVWHSCDSINELCHTSSSHQA
jgi:hypothetical protein